MAALGGGAELSISGLRSSDTVQAMKERLVAEHNFGMYTTLALFVEGLDAEAVRAGGLMDNRTLSSYCIGARSEIKFLNGHSPQPQYREGAEFHHILLEKDGDVFH